MRSSVLTSMLVLCGAMVCWLGLVLWTLDSPPQTIRLERYVPIPSNNAQDIQVPEASPKDLKDAPAADGKEAQSAQEEVKPEDPKLAEDVRQSQKKDEQNKKDDAANTEVSNEQIKGEKKYEPTKEEPNKEKKDTTKEEKKEPTKDEKKDETKEQKSQPKDENKPADQTKNQKQEQAVDPKKTKSTQKTNETPSKDSTKTGDAKGSTAKFHFTPPKYNEAKIIKLSKFGLPNILTAEQRRYGSQYVNLSFFTKPEEPINFLPNYRNPCWYQRETPDSSNATLQCLPSFYIPGVAKCGTTNLYDIISKHHQLAPPNFKEMYYMLTGTKMDPSFFSEAAINISSTVQFAADNKSWYHPLLTFDATPAALYTRPSYKVLDERVNDTFLKVDLIKEWLPSPKAVIILRDPVIRTFSDYNHFVHVSLAHFHYFIVHSLKVWQACMAEHGADRRYCAYFMVDRDQYSPLGMSMYDVFISDWIERFGRDNLHIVRLEDMKADPIAVMTGIFKFLGLEPMKDSLKEELKSNKPPVLSPHQREFLYKAYGKVMMNSTHGLLSDFYRPHLLKLKELLGGDEKWMWGH